MRFAEHFPEILPVTAETMASATLWVSAFIVALFVGSIVLPGPRWMGFEQPSGDRKEYKLSGLPLFLVTHVVLGVGVAFFDWSLAPLVSHFWSLFIVANGWSLVFTLYLFVVGRAKGATHTKEESPLPPVLADLWFGPELNPTLLGVDLKMFMYHPSLIGLAIMNAAFAHAQYETFGAITLEMWLYQAFSWSYLFTHYAREDFMLSTWDIIAERFGFMLVWGDLVYVPFLYSLVGWWVFGHGWTETESGFVHQGFPLWGALLLVAFHVLSHTIFRGANWQKDRFKRNPEAKIWGKTPETLNGRLLISGWWGVGRKINYTGEIGVYISFALCAGFDSPYPYILPLTLIILLTQRAGRDDKRCRAKYGELWEQYCREARFRIIPFVY